MKKTVILLLCMLCCTGCGRHTSAGVSENSVNTTESTAAAATETAAPAETDTANTDRTAGGKNAQTTGDGTHSVPETTGTFADRTSGTQPSQTSSSAQTRQTAATQDEAALRAEIVRKAELILADAKNNANTALSALNAAKQKAEAAQTAYNAAVQKRDAYQSEHKAALTMADKGSLGFFTAVGAQDAVNVLKTAKYASSTDIGNENDATSLTNMSKSFAFMRECNKLRKSEGVGELLVTDRLMAIAQSNLNWSDKNVNHSQQFYVGENLSWNYPDPFTGWYDEEKADRGGHYLNIINDTYQITGFAVCTAGCSGRFSVSHGQVFDFLKSNETAYTVDAYEKRFNQYLKDIETAAAQIKTLNAAVDQASKALTQAKSAVSTAQTAYQNAQTVVSNAQAALDALK